MRIDKNYFAERLTERSTWIGLVGFLGAVGMMLSPEHTQQIVNAGVAVSGLIFGVTPDK